MDIFVGVVLTTLSSIAIAVVSAVHLAPLGVKVETVYEAIKALEALGPYATIMFTIGAISSALLSIMTIILCNTYIIYEVRRDVVSVDEVLSTKLYSIVSVMTIVGSLVIVMAYGFNLKFSPYAFVEMSKTFSIIISLTAWIPSLIVVLTYWRVKIFANTFIRLASGLLIAILIFVNVIGVLGIVIPRSP